MGFDLTARKDNDLDLRLVEEFRPRWDAGRTPGYGSVKFQERGHHSSESKAVKMISKGYVLVAM